MKHPFFVGMGDGIAFGQILPALRKYEVHFYEGGARLFRFTKSRVFTHRAYIDGAGDGEREVGKAESTTLTLVDIRRRAVCHRPDNSELVGVHKLFTHFAVTRRPYRPGELALIDVEARFAANSEDTPELPPGMIDLAFLLPDRRLLFVEAKCVGNSAVRSEGTAKVVTQVRDYERHIMREGVLDALNRSLKVQSCLVGRDLGQSEGVFPKVPVLVLDPTKRGISHRSTDTWLRSALARSGHPEADSLSINVIDGISTPPDYAISQFVAGLRI